MVNVHYRGLGRSIVPWIKRATLFILSLIFLAGNPGCRENEAVPSGERDKIQHPASESRKEQPFTGDFVERVGPSPEKVELTKIANEVKNFPFRYAYFPRLAEVFAGNSNGELLGILWAEADKKEGRRQFRALYVIDPSSGRAIRAAEPDPGFNIFRAALDNRWVTWVEHNRTNWRICALDRETKTRMLVDQGQYFPEAGPDYPSVAVHGGTLVYNVSLIDTGQEMVSRVVACNLSLGKRETLGEIKGTDRYLGPPAIYEDHVVWHRGEWTREMNAEVWLYNLPQRQLRRLSSQNWAAITPAIWGKYVVWSAYVTKTPETKDIVLYNLNTGQQTLLTRAVPSTHLEHGLPTISHGVVTWNTNVPQTEVVVYLAVTGEEPQLGFGGERVALYGSWLTWHNSSSGPGTYVLGLGAFFSMLDLTGPGPEKALKGPPLSLAAASDPQMLARLAPPEIAALYLEAIKQRRWDLVSLLLADDTGVAGKEKYLADLKRDKSRLQSYLVSREYLIEGDKAYVCILERSIQEPDGKTRMEAFPVNWHMSRQHGIWKVDQLAAQ